MEKEKIQREKAILKKQLQEYEQYRESEQSEMRKKAFNGEQKASKLEYENMQLRQQLKDIQAEQKKRDEQMAAANAIQTEQLLSGQLREMTQVLDEFDQKFTRKEKQLDVVKQQNKQMKEAYDTVKEL